MPTVVVILPTQTYRATDFVRAAEALGVDLIVASEAPPPIDMGDRYLQIDCTDPYLAASKVVELGDRVAIDGVVAADDAGVIVAAIAGEKLGLLANSPEAAMATRDKLVQRSRLLASEVPQPDFAPILIDEDPDNTAAAIGFPLVIKPLNRSASQGVIRVDSAEELSGAVARVREIVSRVDAGVDTLLIETFIPGEEVAVEGIIGKGGLTPLAIFDKPAPVDGPGFQETILVTPSRHSTEIQDECHRVASAAVDALGLRHGAVHIELMIRGDQVHVIEVAARSIGGLCSRSLSFGLMDTTLESLILRNALGLDKPELRRDHSASGVLMIPIPAAGKLIAVENIPDVRKLPGVTGVDITIKPGEVIAPPPEGARYLGFVFARGATPVEVESTLRSAMATIHVSIA